MQTRGKHNCCVRNRQENVHDYRHKIILPCNSNGFVFFGHLNHSDNQSRIILITDAEYHDYIYNKYELGKYKNNIET